MKTKIICLTLSLGLLLTGCSLGGKSSEGSGSGSAVGSSQNSSESSADESESSQAAIAEDTSAETESLAEPLVFGLKPYAMDNEKCAVEVPEGFELDKDIIAVSSTLHFNGSEPDDMIALDVFKGSTSEEFDKFDENKMFDLINYTTSEPQVQYFKETTVKNANGINNKAYIGETLGTIGGADTYVTMLAVNCPDDEKMYVLSMRDKTGEYKNYRDNLGDYIYITENGYKVENDKLAQAPEPEPFSHTNESVGYSIELPAGWELVTDTSMFYGLESLSSSFDDYDMFIDSNQNYAYIGSKTMSSNVSEQEFYASMDKYEEIFSGAGGNKHISSKECRIGDNAAYQIVIKHSGPDETTNTSWFINQPKSGKVILASYYYRDEKGAEFADKFINGITFS